jgi:hypothetical protein
MEPHRFSSRPGMMQLQGTDLKKNKEIYETHK